MKFMLLKVGLRNGGFTLIDLMVAMGLGAVAVVTTITVVSQAAKVRRAENLLSSAVAVREQIVKNLARYDNFQETIHYGGHAKFDCLKPPLHNCGVTPGWATGVTPLGSNFKLMVATGGSYPNFSSKPFYDASKASEGFTDDGLLCSSLPSPPTAAAPNRRCPIRVDLDWWSLCYGVCNPGLIGIKVQISTYNSLTKKTHVTPYGFEMIKSVYDDGTKGPFPVY